MSEELDVLKTAITRLDKAKIPYMITGSIACNFYSIPRMTRDIDMIIEIKLSDTKKVYELFKDDFYIGEEEVTTAVREQGMFNIIHNEAIVKVDFIVRKNSEYRRLEFNRRKYFDFEGMKIAIVSPEDLIISKLFWAKESRSEMQINDVKNLIASVEQIDYNYIKKWVKELGIENIFNEVLGGYIT